MFKAFVEFLVDIFAALAQFLGGAATAEEIRQIFNNLMGGLTDQDGQEETNE